MAATAIRLPVTRLRIGRLDDARLAELAATGDERAFEVIYDRHHRPLLGFCRHMLGSQDEGEDALQQTFLRAHRSLLSQGAPEELRPWLFAIARNRCLTILSARKAAAVPVEELEASTDGLAAGVEEREDLRDLLADIARLPDDQRSALVLAEVGDLSHAEIASVIDVPTAKVKALVHQARTRLIADRDARETPCEDIREQLATASGGALRRGPLRRHLALCDGCRAYKEAVHEQRTALALVLPVLPSAGLKDTIFGALGGGGGGAAAAAAGGSAAAGGTGLLSGGGASLGAKLAIGAALVGGAGGSAVVVEKAVSTRDEQPAVASSARQPSTSKPAKPFTTAGVPGASVKADAVLAGNGNETARELRRTAAKRQAERAERRAAAKRRREAAAKDREADKQQRALERERDKQDRAAAKEQRTSDREQRLAAKPMRGNSGAKANPNGSSSQGTRGSSEQAEERSTTSAPRAPAPVPVKVVKPKAVATPKAVPTPSLSPTQGKSDAGKNRAVEEIVP